MQQPPRALYSYNDVPNDAFYEDRLELGPVPRHGRQGSPRRQLHGFGPVLRSQVINILWVMMESL